MAAYYNEIDPRAAATLRKLIRQKQIADGDVDERSIEDVRPADLVGYEQHHFFAGFGLWSLALRMAGWPDTRPVWTGSCPCQPFSGAGKGKGFADERHLWPAWFHLIQHGKASGVPVYGEQVASPRGLAWLDLVSADMEAAGHAVWAFDLCSAGIGAPIIRQRLYWLGRTFQSGLERLAGHDDGEAGREIEAGPVAATGGTGGMADAYRDGRGTRRNGNHCGDDGTIAGADGKDGSQRPNPTNGIWRDADWLFCRDGKWRPVEPGTFPLAVGYPERVGLLRGYGNAICPQLAAAFIRATDEVARTW